MDVLISPGFDRESIDKCMIDELCNFIPLDNIEQRLGTIFVILYEKHFAVYTAKHHNVLFGYNCRNFVMKYLYPRRGNDLYYERVINSSFDHKLKLIDNIFYNNQLPYLIFTNEGLHNNATEENTIIENYTEIDTQKFANIVKSKSCYDKFFVVYLGNDQYMCCIVDSLETYQYSSRIKYRVIQMLYEDVNNLAKLKTEDEELKMRKPLERINNFQLVDIEGHPVEEQKDYYLNMFDKDEDVLDIYDEKIYATYYKNSKIT